MRYLPPLLLLITILTTHHSSSAQSPQLTLDQCYELARENYPLIRQKQLISRSAAYTIDNASKGYLPQVGFSGQATWQTQTIAFPFNIPGIKLPAFSKDQYKTQVEIDQTIYDGGAISNQKALAKANKQSQQQDLEVNLYALRDRIDNLYFGILLIDEQLKLNDLQRADLQNGADKTKAALDNGTAFRSSLDELKAELIKTGQAKTELQANRNAYLQMLSLFIRQPLDPSTSLATPGSYTPTTEIKRPELAQFDYQKKIIDIRERQLKTAWLPKISAFAQGAYGRPTLNFISNQFGFWALGGIRFNWSLTSLYTNKNNKRLLQIDRDNLDIQKETFLLNTNLTLTQQNAEITKYQSLMEQDQQIIELRVSVKNAAGAQLANGVITTHDFITQINAESQARQDFILHRIQLLQSEYNSKLTSGN